jgi:hypothetical protein
VAGDVERGAGLMESGHQAQEILGTTWSEPGRFVMDSCRMLLTGTLADHAEQMAARLDRPGPAASTKPPNMPDQAWR